MVIIENGAPIQKIDKQQYESTVIALATVQLKIVQRVCTAITPNKSKKKIKYNSPIRDPNIIAKLADLHAHLPNKREQMSGPFETVRTAFCVCDMAMSECMPHGVIATFNCVLRKLLFIIDWLIT